MTHQVVAFKRSMQLPDVRTSQGGSPARSAKPIHETVTLAIALRHFAAREKAVALRMAGLPCQRDCE